MKSAERSRDLHLHARWLTNGWQRLSLASANTQHQHDHQEVTLSLLHAAFKNSFRSSTSLYETRSWNRCSAVSSRCYRATCNVLETNVILFSVSDSTERIFINDVSECMHGFSKLQRLNSCKTKSGSENTILYQMLTYIFRNPKYFAVFFFFQFFEVYQDKS